MKTVFAFFLLFSAGAASAQQRTSGTISYLQTVTLDIDSKDIPEGLAGLIPKEHKNEKVLYYNADAALYENKEQTEGTQQEYQQDNATIRIDRQQPDEKLYFDLKNKKTTEQKDLMGRLFLVSEDFKPFKWKFTGRQKKILDMPCMEATTAGDGDSMTVWYTTAIPVNAGPQGISGLPGLVLEANMGKELHMIATAIADATPETQKKIKAPAKGKKISGDEFAKLAREKQEEFEKQYGGNGRVIIKTEVR